MSWHSGTQIVQFEMWGEGVGTARPVTVVQRHCKLYRSLFASPYSDRYAGLGESRRSRIAGSD